MGVAFDHLADGGAQVSVTMGADRELSSSKGRVFGFGSGAVVTFLVHFYQHSGTDARSHRFSCPVISTSSTLRCLAR